MATRGRSRGTSFEQQIVVTRELVRYMSRDEELVAQSRDIVMAAADALVESVYRHLLSHPETAAYFARADGGIDNSQLADRHEALREWLRRTIDAPPDEVLAADLANIGRAHARRGDAATMPVKGRYMLAAISFLQTALLDVCAGSIEDRAVLSETVAAWNKLLMIHLDLFLAAYGSSAGTPHWY